MQSSFIELSHILIGGGGFISVEGFHQVLKETNINLPSEKLEHLCGTGFIVWSEFWQVLLDLDKSLGGIKDSSGLMGKKVFDLYNFNGIRMKYLNLSLLNMHHWLTALELARIVLFTIGKGMRQVLFD
ncbi:unnamed protein product [Fraxinus pennsylvanica]|uniref:Uncharacterized protein n=1 Tax=Fraxinus pennsylvanica TaxID=56036 RepID=A0AAD2DP17_9LAMI|nr:unnamed protein product [Fraxinus pennsylvanica]